MLGYKISEKSLIGNIYINNNDNVKKRCKQIRRSITYSTFHTNINISTLANMILKNILVDGININSIYISKLGSEEIYILDLYNKIESILKLYIGNTASEVRMNQGTIQELRLFIADNEILSDYRHTYNEEKSAQLRLFEMFKIFNQSDININDYLNLYSMFSATKPFYGFNRLTIVLAIIIDSYRKGKIIVVNDTKRKLQ